MSDLPAVGSLARPVRLDPFQRIIEVHWSVGGVVVVELEFIQGQAVINVLVPEFINTGLMGGLTEVLVADYRDDENWYANRVGEPAVIQDGIVTEEALDVWIWDGWFIGSQDEPDINAAAVASGNTSFGPFKLHLSGAQVAWDTQLFRPQIGDWVTHTHPNGHEVIYANGYTPIASGFVSWKRPEEIGGELFNGVAVRLDDPNGLDPADFSETESWYWYHIDTTDERTTAKVRQAFLLYFATERTVLAELASFASMIPDGDTNYNIRGYRTGTEFNVSGGHITAKPGAEGVPPALWELSGTISHSEERQIKFNALGEVA